MVRRRIDQGFLNLSIMQVGHQNLRDVNNVIPAELFFIYDYYYSILLFFFYLKNTGFL